MFIRMLLVGLISLINVSFATTLERNAILAHIQVVLSQLTPLVNQAEQAQDKQSPIQVNFQALRSDIAKISAGIDAIRHPTVTIPRTLSPLIGDYVENDSEHKP